MPVYDKVGASVYPRRRWVVEDGGMPYLVQKAFIKVGSSLYPYYSSSPRKDFSLHNDNDTPTGIGYRNRKFYVLNVNSFSGNELDLTVFIYSADGTLDSQFDITITFFQDSSTAAGLTVSDSIIYFVRSLLPEEGSWGSVVLARDFSGNSVSGGFNTGDGVVRGMHYQDGIVYVCKGSGNVHSITRYRTSDGTKLDPTWNLRMTSGTGGGFTIVGDEMFLINTNRRVFVYSFPAAQVDNNPTRTFNIVAGLTTANARTQGLGSDEEGILYILNATDNDVVVYDTAGNHIGG